MNHRTKNLMLSIGLLGGVGCLMVWGVLTMLRDVRETVTKPAEQNPYQYDMDALRKTDEAPQAAWREVGAIPLPLDHPKDLALDASGTLYVCGGNEILVVKNGEEAKRIELDEPVRCIDVDKDGKLYAAFSRRVVQLNQQGELEAEWGDLGELAEITAIAAGPALVYVADYGNRRVWKFDKTGQLLEAIDGVNPNGEEQGGFIIPSPYFDLTLDVNGDGVWIVNPGRLRVEHYTPDGERTGHWGKSGWEAEEFCGCCNPTHIVQLPDGSFVTSEKGIERVKHYSKDGAFIGYVAPPESFDSGVTGLALDAGAQGRVYILDPSWKQARIFEEGLAPYID
ncbi:NHL repeat-containing protein [Candidatus Sumerlaeota bacterium]|nr:NHL repeat-containing protein [Candidatus Sumerlaeota bacterium]